MSEIIYGIDTTKEVTPLMVRDGIIKCFQEAHCMDSGATGDEKDTNNLYCLQIVKKAFADAGGDFDNPSTQDIMEAIEKLAEFAKNFRDPSIIEKHYKTVMELVNKLK